MLSGLDFINRNGLRWCDVPEAYGPHKTLYSRWKRWSEKGMFARILLELSEYGGGIDRHMIDVSRGLQSGVEKGGAVV